MRDGNVCDENPSHSLDKQQTERDTEMRNEDKLCDVDESNSGHTEIFIDNIRSSEEELNDGRRTLVNPKSAIKRPRNRAGERPYSCTRCKKSYKTLSNLTTHRKAHAAKDLGTPLRETCGKILAIAAEYRTPIN